MEGIERPDWIESKTITSRPNAMGAWREFAVLVVMAVSVVVFVRLGKYLGQKLNVSPPVSAILLAAPTTIGAGLIAKHLLTQADTEEAVYDYPTFVEEENEKQENFAADANRNVHWYFIEKEGVRHRVEDAMGDWYGNGVERFKEKWTGVTGEDEVPPDVKLFVDQKLGETAQHAALDRVGKGWMMIQEDKQPTPHSGFVAGTDPDNRVIEGHFRVCLFDPEGDMNDRRYVNTRVVVNASTGMTKVYVDPPTDEPVTLEVYA